MTPPPDAVAYQACPACPATWSLPRPACPACGHAPPETRAASGAGEVWSVTEITRAAPPAFAALAPYAIALITLAEGPRLMAHVPPGLSVGAPVTGRMETIETAEGPRRLPVFRPR